MEDLKLKSKVRTGLGRGATKQLRSEGYIPVNVYGHKEDNRHLAIEYKAFERFVSEGHRILSLEFEGGSEHGVLKEIQYDHLGTHMIHVDIARVSLTERITLSVPVVLVGTAKGQSAGGTLDLALKEVEIEGPANAIPESIEVRVAELGLNESIRIKDLDPVAKCELKHDDEVVVVAVHEARAEPEEPAEGEAASAEPEVISKKKDDENADG